MRAAVDGTETSSLLHLLGAMVAKEPATRPSLQEVLTSCAHLAPDDAMDEVNELVSLVLGRSEYVKLVFHCPHGFIKYCFLQTSSEDETDVSEENLDHEVRAEGIRIHIKASVFLVAANLGTPDGLHQPERKCL